MQLHTLIYKDLFNIETFGMVFVPFTCTAYIHGIYNHICGVLIDRSPDHSMTTPTPLPGGTPSTSVVPANGAVRQLYR